MTIRYDAGVDAMASSAVSFTSTPVRAALVNTTYTAVAGDAIAAIDAAIAHSTHRAAAVLSGKSVAAGKCDAANTTWTGAQVAGSAQKNVVTYFDPDGVDNSGDEIPIAHYDGGDFPILINGGPVEVDWNDTNGVIQL